MRKPSFILQTIFWVIAAADIIAIAAGITELHFIAKPLLMPTLMMQLFSSGKNVPGKNTMQAALFFSWLGDIFLLTENKNSLFFIFGLCSFLLTHILYIIYFTGIKNSTPSLLKKQPIFVVLAVMYGTCLVWLLFPKLGDLKFPVIIYAAVICTMLLCGLHVFLKVNKKAAWLFVTGALLFVVSDSALAVNKFYSSFTAAGIIIMLTYCAAQHYIITGFIKQTTMTKAELLAELSNNTYVMLKPSAIEGIGVFAITDIPKGCRSMFGAPDAPEDWLTISKKDIENLPAHARLLVGNYCLFDEENYYLPAHGFKRMDVSLFLNHAATPNIISINDGDYFEALRDIKAGEELVIDYEEIVNG